MTTNEVAVVADSMPDKRALEIIVARRELIRDAIGKIMVDGHHYGVIPGTEGPAGPDGKKKEPKKVLLKPGAECLCNLFQLTPTFDPQIRELPNEHREIRMTCTLTHRGSGAVVASANGSCSTMESKYRWRLASRKCPDCGSDAIRKSKHEEGFYCWSKIGGCGAKFPEGDKRIIEQEQGRAENPDITDAHHTVMMMAQKRALVAATRLALAASDLFMDEERAEEDRDDEDEKPRRRQQTRARREEPAHQEDRNSGAMQLTPRQEAMRDLVGIKEDLIKKGVTQQMISDILGQHGIVMPAKLGDADDEMLFRMRDVLKEQLEASGGAS